MTANDFVFIQQAIVGKANSILQEIASLVVAPTASETPQEVIENTETKTETKKETKSKKE